MIRTRIHCEWARGKVRFYWCRAKCKLFGAAICPRSPSFVKIIQQEAKNGAR